MTMQMQSSFLSGSSHCPGDLSVPLPLEGPEAATGAAEAPGNSHLEGALSPQRAPPRPRSPAPPPAVETPFTLPNTIYAALSLASFMAHVTTAVPLYVNHLQR